MSTALRTHVLDDCIGEFCPIHNPSGHHMREWPITIRFDRGALTERVCSHGCGHPDPDSLAYFRRKLGDRYPRYALGVHGCDGCCRP